MPGLGASRELQRLASHKQILILKNISTIAITAECKILLENDTYEEQRWWRGRHSAHTASRGLRILGE